MARINLRAYHDTGEVVISMYDDAGVLLGSVSTTFPEYQQLQGLIGDVIAKLNVGMAELMEKLERER